MLYILGWKGEGGMKLLDKMDNLVSSYGGQTK